MTPLINQTGNITYQKLEAEGWESINISDYYHKFGDMMVWVITDKSNKNVEVFGEHNHVFSCITFEQINAFLNIIKEGDL